MAQQEEKTMTTTTQPPADNAPAGPPSRVEGDSPPTVLRLDVAWGSHPGVARGYNEDAIQGTPVDQPPSSRGYLYLVADGMGGHNAGEVASAGAAKLIYEGYYADADPSVHRSLDRVVRLANAELYAQAQANPAQHGMGTTLTGVVIQGDRAYIAHVGDSRLYRVRGGRAEQLTQDHSWVAEQVRAGVLSPDQAEVHPQRNVITRALATAPDVKVDHSDVDLQVGDVLVLCSDGLSTEVGDSQIAALTTKAATAQEAVQKLIKLANDNGGEDNISVAVIRLLGEGSGVMAAVLGEGVTEKVPTVAGGRPAHSVSWLLIGVIAAVVLIGGGLAAYFAIVRRGPSTPVVAPDSASLAGTAPAVGGPAATATLDLTAEASGAAMAPQTGLVAETPALPADASAEAGAGEPTATLAPTFTAQPRPSPEASRATSSRPTQVAEPTARSQLVAAPILGDPVIGATEAGPSVRFTWNTSGRSLQPGDAYALLVWPASNPRYSGCSGLDCPAAFDACRDPLESTFWTIPDFEKGPGGAGPGDYLWTVVIVDTTRSDPSDPSRCAVISEQPPSHRFSYAPSSGPPESTAAPL
jgi:serine/threonine protein phosphatase PrpC